MKKLGTVDVKLACIVLAELSKTGQVRRTQLEKQTYQHCGTRATFDRVFAWLKSQGFIVKASTQHMAPYQITSRGKQFLEAFNEQA